MTFDREAPRMKLGMITDHRPCPVPDLAVFATQPLPAPAAKIPVPNVGKWPMAGNDQYGDCTIAGVIHADQAYSAITNEPWFYPGDDVVEETYFGLSGGADTGLMIDDVLQQWHDHGLDCAPHKIGPWAPVNPQNAVALKQCVDFFGAAYIGVNLPAVAQQQFANAEAWDLTGTEADYNLEGGHSVVLVGYDSLFYAVTWGRVQPVTLRWLYRYCTQARAIIPAEFEARGGDARGISISKLDAWVTKLAA